tara:strand:- start:5467 stop:5811 length:345 start_codon:yes stop_codon:yes gene_type:complete
MTKQFITITAAKAAYPANLADELGALQAQIADLREVEAHLKDQLVDQGSDVIEGNFFKATISQVASATPIDYKAAFLALVPKTRLALASEYTKFRSGSVRVAVKARPSSARKVN